MSPRAVSHTVFTLIAVAGTGAVAAAGGRDPWAAALAGFMLAVALFLALLLAVRNGEPLRRPAPDIIILLTIAWFAGLAVYRGVLPVAAPFLVRMGTYALAFGTAFVYCGSDRRIRRFCVTLAAAGAVFALWGLIKFLTDLAAGHGTGGLSGPFVNKNHFAGLMEILLPCAAALFFFPFKRSQKLAALYPLVIMAAGLGFSLSRGGWISFGIGLVVYLIMLVPLGARTGRLAAVVTLALIVGLTAGLFRFIGLTPIQAKVTATMDDEYLGLAGRSQMWAASFDAIRAHPGGFGPGTYPYAFTAYRPRGLACFVTFAHNDYIQAAFEGGVIGLVLLVILIERLYNTIFAAFYQTLDRLKRKAFTPECDEAGLISRAGILMGAAAVLTAIVVHSLVDFNLHLAGNGIFFALIMGLAMRVSADTAAEAAPADKRA
ncbi:MAG: O-antigen ligase family protein [Planctomycetota bacterium]